MGNLNIIFDSRNRLKIAKGPKYSFPEQIDFQTYRKNAASLNEFCNRLCNQQHVESSKL